MMNTAELMDEIRSEARAQGIRIDESIASRIAEAGFSGLPRNVKLFPAASGWMIIDDSGIVTQYNDGVPAVLAETDELRDDLVILHAVAAAAAFA